MALLSAACGFRRAGAGGGRAHAGPWLVVPGPPLPGGPTPCRRRQQVPAAMDRRAFHVPATGRPRSTAPPACGSARSGSRHEPPPGAAAGHTRGRSHAARPSGPCQAPPPLVRAPVVRLPFSHLRCPAAPARPHLSHRPEPHPGHGPKSAQPRSPLRSHDPLRVPEPAGFGNSVHRAAMRAPRPGATGHGRACGTWKRRQNRPVLSAGGTLAADPRNSEVARHGGCPPRPDARPLRRLRHHDGADGGGRHGPVGSKGGGSRLPAIRPQPTTGPCVQKRRSGP